jgi:hypothetical protein
MLFGLVLVLFTLAGCTLFEIRPVWFRLPVSAEAMLYDLQFSRTLWISGGIFVAVQLARLDGATRRPHGRRGYQILRIVECRTRPAVRPDQNRLHQRFSRKFHRYRSCRPDGKDDIVTANLGISAGRHVLLLHSRDVIHDFFVRELRTRQDIVPGMERSAGRSRRPSG